jgi:hypothetical protein
MIEPDLEHTSIVDDAVFGARLKDIISFLLNLDVGLSEEDIHKICGTITNQVDAMVMFGN